MKMFPPPGMRGVYESDPPHWFPNILDHCPLGSSGEVLYTFLR